MARILWCINTLTEVDGQAFPDYLVHSFRLGRRTQHDMILFTPRRMTIASGRNSAAKMALEAGCDYVFFSDDDMLLHPLTLQTLLERDCDIIMAMCCIRGYPFKPMVFKWTDVAEQRTSIADVKMEGKLISLWDNCEESVGKNGLIEPAAAVGCAATLVKTEVFRLLNEPWFYTGTANTEDVYFCIKAQEYLEGVRIAVDTTVPAGHLLKEKRVLYPWNAALLKEQEDAYADLFKLHQPESMLEVKEHNVST